MADPKKREFYLKMADADMSELMKGAQPRLIDEWQDAPQFWGAIRYYSASGWRIFQEITHMEMADALCAHVYWIH